MKTSSIPFFRTLVALSAILGATQLASAAADTWTGSSGANWATPGNWTGGNAPPVAGDLLLFGPSTPTTLNNNLTAGTPFDGMTIQLGAPAFTFNGNSILLSGSTNGTMGITNNSGLAQVFGTMSLTLDQGYYTFSSPSGGSLALNGGLALNLGGVACFDNNVTSTSLSADGLTGLITGLEGAGLMYDGSYTPTGLATISGGVISAYSGYTPVASGAIPNGNNINLTASGAAAPYTAANTTVNTISAAQVG
jgi:hypothetical protein